MGSAFICGFLCGVITLAFVATISNIGKDDKEEK